MQLLDGSEELNKDTAQKELLKDIIKDSGKACKSIGLT